MARGRSHRTTVRSLIKKNKKQSNVTASSSRPAKRTSRGGQSVTRGPAAREVEGSAIRVYLMRIHDPFGLAMKEFSNLSFASWSNVSDE